MSESRRILILGASGCGTSTLGRALATKLGVFHGDSDDYFWKPTDPPFETPRPTAEREDLLEADLERHRSFVLSGSYCGWADYVAPHLSHAVFLRANTQIRSDRIAQRESARFGESAIAPGGVHYEKFRAFLAWAQSYERGGVSRTLAIHEAWLEQLKCSVLRLQSDLPVADLLERVLQSL